MAHFLAPHSQSEHRINQDFARRDPIARRARHVEQRRSAILVLGMHRSGTSAVAGTLHHLGVAFGSNLLEPGPDNPRGFFEHANICDLHEELLAQLGSASDDPRALPQAWHADARVLPFRSRIEAVLRRDFAGPCVWAVKDPRLCRLLPMWIPLVRALGAQMGCVLVVRHPSEVAASLAVRSGMSPVHAGLLWLRYVLEAEQATRGERHAWLLYQDLVADWRPSVEYLSHSLGIDWPSDTPGSRASVSGFLAGEFRHHESASYAEFGAPLGPWLERAYDVLSQGTDAARVTEVTDAVRDELAAFDQPGRITYIPKAR